MLQRQKRLQIKYIKIQMLFNKKIKRKHIHSNTQKFIDLKRLYKLNFKGKYFFKLHYWGTHRNRKNKTNK